MKKILHLSIMALVSLPALAARTDCPAAKVLNIQIEGQKVMYQQEGASWRTLGFLNKDDGTKERYSALLTAQATGKKVVIGYSVDNYDCSAANYMTEAHMIRIYNQ
ncbi:MULTISPECIES: hypothetical protein [unclassified Pseudoalteromonas]|uniref:hypothetical protein n=1 Tax=unclassified Pseudoalteromonas TaxID=194690 RepID=UPI002097689B|nr:hypothetical protein [Pseudoalteromonas sp. XMcav2-N]MCO7191407.1 hypothetical protein [Pseudoalteromonas sp. XMcav2-N]